ncbi:MAG: thiamine pyrophosphate-binding protein [Bauldia litoralis]
MPKLTAAHALVNSIRAHGVDTVFGLPGVQLDGLFNALWDERDSLRVIESRHEQGVAYMAFGYAQSTGKVGTFAVVPGPGVLNAGSALATAYACNAPVLCLTGQIPSAQIGRGLGLLHEIPHQLEVLRGLTKWCTRVDHGIGASDAVREAFRQLRSGRRRPVAIEMAMDVMHAEQELALTGPAPDEPPAAPDPDQIEAAAKLLGNAKAPLIVAGGGAIGGEEALQALAETLQAPVSMWRSGRGLLSDRHDLGVTQPVGHAFWGEADVVLAVGTRLQQQRMGWGTNGLKIVNINIDPHDINALGRPEIGIVADAPTALAALADAVPKHNATRSDGVQAVRERKAQFQAAYEQQLAPQMAYLKAMRDALPDDGFFIEDLTQVGYVCRFGFPIYQPRTMLNSGYQGTLGHSLATGLGVKVANPDRAVLSISGDGGLMFVVQELATAAKHGIAAVHVVFNDNAYGNVQRMQVEDYGGKVIASDLQNPDFVKLAESFGVLGLRAESPDALRSSLETAFGHGGPVLVEVPMGKMPSPWEFIALGRNRPA